MKKRYCNPRVTVKAVQVEDGYCLSNGLLILGCSEEFGEAYLDFGSPENDGGGMLEGIGSGATVAF